MHTQAQLEQRRLAKNALLDFFKVYSEDEVARLVATHVKIRFADRAQEVANKIGREIHMLERGE